MLALKEHHKSNMKIKEFVDNWQLWGLPAFASIFAPWHEKITNMALISDFYQPTLNVGGTVLGPLSCLVVFSTMHKIKMMRLRKFVRICFILFMSCLLGCIVLKNTIDIFIFPSVTVTPIIRIMWIVLYIGLFVFLGATMTGAAILIGRNASR